MKLGKLLAVVLLVTACESRIGSNRDDDQYRRIEELQQLLEDADSKARDMELLIVNLQKSVVSLGSMIAALLESDDLQAQQIGALTELAQDLETQLTAAVASIEALETDVQAQQQELAVLQGHTSIGEIIDPCGDTQGKIDEVLLKLTSGQILVSFSDNVSGLNTRFSVLNPGTYMVTDGTGCIFTLHNNGTVTW